MVILPNLTQTPNRVRVLVLAAAAAMLFLFAPAGLARTPLEQEWARYKDWQLDWFRLEGAPAELKKDLRRGLALAGQNRFLRSPVLPRLNTRLLQEDMARVRLFLAREGYPAAAVTAEAFPVPGKSHLGLTLIIEAGPAVKLAAVDLEGWPSGAALPDSTAKEMFRRGERFGDGKLESSRLFLSRLLRNSGYALAEVSAAARPLSATEVVAVYHIVAGVRYDITEVSISGCSPDLENLTRRLLDLNPPLTYSHKKLDDAAVNLRSTQLYRQVILEIEPLEPGRLHLLAKVENAKMRTVETSVGTWSDNPWMVRAGWAHRNLLGGGKGLDARIALATHNQSVGGGLSQFGWLSPRARTRVGVEWLREDEEAYLARELRLNLVQSQPLGEKGMAHVGISLSRVDLVPYLELDRSTIEGKDNLLELWADRKWDWTDNPLFPTRGGFFKLTGTLSPPNGLTESPYALAQADLSVYRGLGRQSTLAGRLRTGVGTPLGQAESIIPNRRFFAGGYSTMRGYGRRELGPRDASGVAQGGQAVLLAGLEARVPVIWIVELAFFLDSGQVWWEAKDVRLSDLETAAGVVLDLRTPLGPVRFGYAWNLGDVYPGQPRSQAHFGVGYPW